MSANFIAKATILIEAPPKTVWKALTTPELIRQYFYGTQAISDWRVGSEIRFTGVWQGKEYADKGVIQKVIPGELLQHTYFSSFSGLEDSPENYSNVVYELNDEDGQTQLAVRQENLPSEEARESAEKNWAGVLERLKEVVESLGRKEDQPHLSLQKEG